MSRLKLADTPTSVQQDGICLMKAVLAYDTNVRDVLSLRDWLGSSNRLIADVASSVKEQDRGIV